MFQLILPKYKFGRSKKTKTSLKQKFVQVILQNFKHSMEHRKPFHVIIITFVHFILLILFLRDFLFNIFYKSFRNNTNIISIFCQTIFSFTPHLQKRNENTT